MRKGHQHMNTAPSPEPFAPLCCPALLALSRRRFLGGCAGLPPPPPPPPPATAISSKSSSWSGLADRRGEEAEEDLTREPAGRRRAGAKEKGPPKRTPSSARSGDQEQ